MKIKSALRGSEKTAPNILFKKLNIIYKSIFHKQLFFHIYISTWKSFYKGDTSFSHTDPPVKIYSLRSPWSCCLGVGAALRQAQRTVCGHQVWLYLIQVKSTHQQPETNILGSGCNPGPPRPHDLGQHRGDGPRESASWTSVANEASCWLRYRTSCLSFLTSSCIPLYSLLPA